MDNIQSAIENITYRSKNFPAEEFQYIRTHSEEAKPYLRAALDRTIAEDDELDEDYQLSFYAIFFLAEFRDTESFGRIIALASLPEDTLDYLLGDAVTESLKDILYNTYDGRLNLLKDAIKNPDHYEYARIAMLDVMGQLYLDGVLDKDEWQDYLKELVWNVDETSDVFTTFAADVICRCHLWEMLPEIRHLFDKDLIDEYICGKYDSFIDTMFSYDKWNSTFCMPSVSAEQLKTWAMFEQDEKQSGQEFDFLDGIAKQARKNALHRPSQNQKIGRNDPCPCGSGKKYKHCCLNKPKNTVETIETKQERQKWLKNYPETGTERIEGRIYLEDYFDSDSIETDKLIYLALKHRPIPIWEQPPDRDQDRRQMVYLREAFSRYSDKMQAENIASNREYDEKYSIHYPCREWLGRFLVLLQDNGDKEEYQQVLEYYKK